MVRLFTILLGVWIIMASSHALSQSPGPTITQDGLILQSNASATGNGTPINVGGFGIITYQVTALSGAATIVPESSIDGTNYNTLTCYALDGTTSVTYFSGTGTWRCNVTGQNWARARISVCAACTVSIQATKWVSGQVSKSPTHIPVPVTDGGTGDTTLASGAYLKGAGTSPVTSQAVPIPCTDGGTGLTSGTSGGVLAYTGTCTLASSGALNQHGVVIGGGAGAPPTSTGTGTSGQFLISNGAGNDPTFQTKTIPTVPISAANGGTGIDSSALTGLPYLASSGVWSVNTSQNIQVTEIGIGGAPAVNAPIKLYGFTSGSSILQAQSAAGATIFTLPTASGTLVGSGDSGTVTGTMIAASTVTQGNLAPSSVGTVQLKTTTGTASSAVTINVVMNDYAFFPSLYNTASDLTTRLGASTTAPSGAVGQFLLVAGASGTNSATWRYFTSTDNPYIYLLIKNGLIIAVWAADDPAGGGQTGLIAMDATESVVTVRPSQLDVSNAPAGAATTAQAWITSMKYSLSNLNYRTLQQWATGACCTYAPSIWILQHGTWDAVAQVLRFTP